MEYRTLRSVPVVLWVLYVLQPFVAWAQVESLRSVQPSPEAATLVKVEDVPVGLHTGTPSVAIPLHTVQSFDLALPITLNHHGAAVKPSDEASWVGLGWSLSAGGVITRAVRGEPDEYAKGYFNTGRQLVETGYGDAYFETYDDLHDPDYEVEMHPPLDGSFFLDMVELEKYDPEPDQYYFSFAGQSGRFIVEPKRDGEAKARFHTVPLRDVHITYETGSVPAIDHGFLAPDEPVVTKWTITTEDGTQYIFSEVELSDSKHYDNGVATIAKRPDATSWYLTEVRSAQGEATISLEYAAARPVSTRTVDEKHTTLIAGVTHFEWHVGFFRSIYDNTGLCQFPPGIRRHETVATHYQKALSAITTPFETIAFVAETTRLDQLDPASGAAQTTALDRIVIRNALGVTTREIVFAYDYFEGADEPAAARNHYDSGARLRLLSVTAQGGAESPLVHRFAYYPISGGAAGGSVPTRLQSRDTKEIDHWGYYNGRPNETLVPEYWVPIDGEVQLFEGGDREPAADERYLLPGMLYRIYYPTGGHTEFEYELHDYGTEAYRPVTTSNPVRIEKYLGNSDWNSYRKEVQVFRTEPFVVGGMEERVYPKLTITGEMRDVAGLGACAPNGPCLSVKVLDAETNEVMVTVRSSEGRPWNPAYSLATPLRRGRSYVIEAELGFTYDDATCATKQCQWGFSARLNWVEVNPAKRKHGGGLRVKRIIESSGIGPDKVRTFEYRLSGDPERSSGVLVTVPRYQLVDWGGTGPCQFYTRSGRSYVPLGHSQGSMVGYEEVTVYYGDVTQAPGGERQGSEGKTVYHFETSLLDGALNDRGDRRRGILRPETLPFGVQILRPWKYGVGKREQHFDRNGALQSETRTTTVFSDMPSAQGGEPERFRRSLGLHLVPYYRFDGSGIQGMNVWHWGWYEESTAYTHPDEVTVSAYDATGTASIRTVQNYDHRSPTHLQLTHLVETNSDGRVRTTAYEYAHERQQVDMARSNRIAQRASTTVYDGTTVVRKQWTCWAGGTNGLWRPWSEWTWAGGGNPATVSPCETTNVTTLPYTHAASGAQVTRAIDAYDRYGRVSMERDARGYAMQLTYGGANDGDGGVLFLRAVSKGGLSVRYRYHASGAVWGLLHEFEDENAQVTTYDYDGMGRLASVTGPFGRLAEYRYVYANGNVTTSPSYVETRTYLDDTRTILTRAYVDGLGRPTQTQEQEDGDWYVVSTTEYDARGRPARDWLPVRQRTGGAFLLPGDAYRGSVATAYQSTDCASPSPFSTTRYTPDPLGRVAVVVPPFCGAQDDAPEVTYTYGVSESSLKVQVVDENLNATATYTDGWGRQVRTEAGSGLAQTQFKYDVLGQLRRVTDPEGRVTYYRYDARGLLIGKTTPDADGDGDGDPVNETGAGPDYDFEYVYDAGGNLRLTLDPRRVVEDGVTKRQHTYARYDALGRVVESGVYVGDLPPSLDNAFPGPGTRTHSVVRYTYDDAFLLKPAVIPLRHRRGHVVEVVFPGGYRHYSYDAAGRVEAMYVYLDALGSGRRVDYAYDRQGNVEKVSYQAGGDDAFFTWYRYGPAGRLSRVYTSLTDLPDGAVEASATLEASYTYEPGGQVRSLRLGTAPDGSPIQVLDYRYHIRGWLTAINDIYDPRDRASFAPDRFALRLGYDDLAGAPLAAAAQRNGNVAWAAWRTEGNVNAGIEDRDHDGRTDTYPIAGYAFHYDAMNRLTRADFSKYDSEWRPDRVYDVGLDESGVPAPILYDRSGNIERLNRFVYTRGTGSNPDRVELQTIRYTYVGNRVDRLVGTVGDLTFGHDASGNVTEGRTLVGVAYDHRNLPTQATSRGDGIDLTFAYDEGGQRISKQSDGMARHYVRGPGGEVLAVYDGEGELLYWNILAAGNVIGRLSIGMD